MKHYIRTSATIPLPREEVFSFFANAENLERITPPELKFKIITPKPIPVEKGCLIDYSLQLFFIPFRWQTLISLWDPPHCFVDEQVRGPYREWTHTHRFEPGEEGTRISDEVCYQLPFWPLGELVYPLVRLQLVRIFQYRQKTIKELLRPAHVG